MYCLTAQCNSARCIASHAGSVWEVCDRCGGTEYVDGHIDPETATERCDCIHGLTELSLSRPLADVASEVEQLVALRPESVAKAVAPTVIYESWPAGGGAPVRWTGR
ncbi:hypothetical protein C5F51_36225 [Nocardia nova]|uniref:Uncharacterized protein n=1 Tax=Nocardia nova TaxID=37330 RepID=A0A2S5ZUD8_9NOCA|nr:hypothetical protein C5F51_36225 [Nocardia nova]